MPLPYLLSGKGDMMTQLIRTGAEFERTPEETADPELFWQRDDQAFFAAGACHILAYQFQLRYPLWRLVYLQPANGQPGQHVYATNSIGQAFDHNGVTVEHDLLAAISAAYRVALPAWTYPNRFTISCTLEEFCHRYDHWLPEQFAHDPRPRADRFIDAVTLSMRRPATS
jgi:hypothetical protein